MTDPLAIVLAIAVVATVGFVLWRIWQQPEAEAGGDDYLHALELWLEGDEEGAAELLTTVVHDDPSSVAPYLQLGNLLRKRGDAVRAAVLHRGLTVRPGLSTAQKVAVGLALAADLIDLARWNEAGLVLDDLVQYASGEPAYWRARFAQHHGLDDHPQAARTLKSARRKVARGKQAEFDAGYAAYQLDRALRHARSGEAGPARDRLRDVDGLPAARTRAALVRAVLAASEGDAAAAVTVVSEELLDSPRELEIFLPQLQDVLLQSGQFARTVSILERACQSDHAPPSLWISLALLYEKLEDRDHAMRLLESKAGRADLTPDAAAPYLRLLAREAAGTDLARAWETLSMPTIEHGWSCSGCGHREPRIRWFCDRCRGFDTFEAPRAGGA